jgi:hypothetical protein
MANMIRTSILGLTIIVAAGCSKSATLFRGPTQEKSEKTPKKPRGHFTISKETTYVSGPLDKHGYIDYAAALNKRLSKGVTPAKNANVLIWKALGPHPEKATMPPEFFKLMSIQAPPERGDYFIEFSRYLNERLGIIFLRDMNYQLDRTTQRPWTAKEYPKIAGWLKANEKPLAVVIQATKRSHYFSPILPEKTKKGSTGLIGAQIPGVQKCRELASALVARAMLHTGQGAYDDAWRDLLACHRLGRLVGRGGSLIDALVGIAIDTLAGKADLAFLERGKLTAKRIESCLGDLHRLAPLPDIADKVNLCERFSFLEVLMMIDREGLQYLNRMSGAGRSEGSSPLAENVMQDIDWDPALRNANRWYDRLVATMRETDRASRAKKLDQIGVELKALKKKIVEGGFINLYITGKKNARAKGEALGNLMISLLLPAVQKVQDSSDRARQIQDNLIVAFALAWYQRDHGRYPKKLAALGPKYLKQVPQDRFSGEPLIYRLTDKGYLLYSVGVNGKDEGGRGYEDEPKGDDLSVRMPLPKLRGPEKNRK